MTASSAHFNLLATSQNPAPPVKYQLDWREKEWRKELYTDYYDRQIGYIREYFKYKGYETADAFLDVLLEEKGDKLRKDGYSPDYGHEIDLLLARISAVESGQIDVEAAEAEYGPIESMFISTLVHDLAEDYGLMPSDLKEKAHTALNKKIGASISQHHFALIHRGAQSMERLTHDRHYSVEEFQEQFGAEFEAQYPTELDIPSPRDDAPISLNEDVKEFLWNKMDILPDQDNTNFQAFIKRTDKGKLRISVTRYGAKNGFGADWNAYSSGFRSNPYDAINKFGDSANGMTSRLAIESFTAYGYSRYLSKREMLFKLTKIAPRTMNDYDALKYDITSIGSMMVISNTIGRLLLSHDPRMNREGESRFSALNLEKDEDGLIYMDLKGHPEDAFNSYALVPGLSHPIARFMQQYRDVVDFYQAENHPWYEDVKFLYEQTRAILIRDCAEPCARNGLNIVDLIDNPERIDPMPKILEKVHNGNVRPAAEAYTMPLDYT